MWACLKKKNTQQIIAEVKALQKSMKKLWKFKLTVNQIYCT